MSKNAVIISFLYYVNKFFALFLSELFDVEFNLVMCKNSLTTFLAIDLVAINGRFILGTIQNDTFVPEEINRSPDPIIEIDGRLYRDLFYHYNEIFHSLKKIKSEQRSTESILLLTRIEATYNT